MHELLIVEDHSTVPRDFAEFLDDRICGGVNRPYTRMDCHEIRDILDKTILVENQSKSIYNVGQADCA